MWADPPSWWGAIRASENQHCSCRCSRSLPERDRKFSISPGRNRQSRSSSGGSGSGPSSPNLLILVEIALENILQHIKRLQPPAVVIDSIQTVYSSALSSAPGSVGQVREASEQLILLAKKDGHPGLSGRPCHEGRFHRRPEGARAHGGYGPLF